MYRCLIAFNLPPDINENTIIDAIKNNVDLCYSICNIEFYNDLDHKNAKISFCIENDAKKTFTKCNDKTVNGIYFDLIYSDNNVLEFLKKNKKTLYFKLNSIELKDLTLHIQKYEEIQKVHYNEKKRIGYFVFESTEKALKTWHNLKQTLNKSDAEVGFESFEESLSVFLNRARTRKTDLSPYLKKGNESSIFVFDLPQLDGNLAIDEEFLRGLFEDYKIDKSESSVSFHKRYNYDLKISFYAIIIFENRENAIKAIHDLNYTKLDLVPIRLVLADDYTRSIIASNDGKLLISNLDVDIEIFQLHNAFANFGEVVECEIPTDNGISRGYGYVQFRSFEDAKQAKNDLIDASINGHEIGIDFIENDASFDKQKQFLFNENFETVKYFKKKSDDLNSMLFNLDFSLFDHIDADFVISVNENQIECSRFLASFLSPHIANNKSISKFEIKIYRLDKGFSMVYEIVNFLFSFLNRKNISKKNLQTLITKTVEQIISSMLIGNLKEQLNKTVDDCSEFLLNKIEANQDNNDDFILSFIVLVEIFAQFGNDAMIQYLNNLLLSNIKKTDSIENDQVLYIRTEIKKIMKDTKTEVEVNYIKDNFNEIDPCILNEIEIKTIENAVQKIDHEKNEDKFLCKILRLDDNYKKHLLFNYVNFEYVSNEAMKIFLSSIDFSFVDESLLNTLSVRLSFPIIQTREIDDQNIPFHFSHVIKYCIQNSVLKQNFKDFTIFVNNKKIEINTIYATLISPQIKKYIQTDRTCSSFYLRFDSNQVDFFNEFANSLSFFISKEKIDDVSQIAIENKFYDHLCQINEIIDSKGIDHLETFFNNLHSNEKSALNYACWVSLLIYLGNFKIAEFLINSLVRSNNQEITGIDDVLMRLHHKEVLKYQNEIKVDISSEKTFISNNFNDFFTNIEDFNEINEDLWIVISIRLSLDIYTKLDAKLINK